VSNDLECAERQLNRLIEDWIFAAKAENERAAMWAVTVRSYNLAHTRERRAAWADQPRRTIDAHEGLARQHRDRLLWLVDGGEGIR
jgi:hypothetical protein